MKGIFTIISLILSLGLFAQYPLIEDFSSINGPGEWINYFGQPDVCSYNNAELRFNCTGTYNTNDTYVVLSPYYGSRFVLDVCDSVRITFKVDVNTRPGDRLYIVWSDYAAPGVFGALVPGTGIWTLLLPPQIEWFAIQFETFGTGSPIGKYVNFDWFEIGCIYYLFDIDLYEFSCETNDNGISITSRLSEESDIILEYSPDAISWETITESTTTELNYLHNTTEIQNYYRVLYDGKISSTIHCEDESPNLNIQNIRYFNVLGQEIKEPIKYHLRQITYENGSVKTTLIHRQ
tara:strand:+ start:3352 stop:4227 length:876 start_codon:yes stop_codon:yes gene_type:complete